MLRHSKSMVSPRVEGIGVGWVSILANKDLHQILGIPKHIRPIAYLCLGYVEKFSSKPDLEVLGWISRLGLSDVICLEQWGVTNSDNWQDFFYGT